MSEMTIYPEQQKESLVKRMLPPSHANVPKLSRETGIPQDTLYGWRRQAQRAQGLTRTPAAPCVRIVVASHKSRIV